MPLRSRITSSGNITEHVRLIHEQVAKSMRDPELRQLTVKVVSDSYEWRRNPRTGQEEPYIRAWGKWFKAPPGGACGPKNAECEIVKIWNFVVLNVRYVYDPASMDLFSTAKETLLAGGGDCDDMDIVFEAMLGLIGFPTQARVISTADNPDEWVHVYTLVPTDKDRPKEWLALDATVSGARPGWEYPDIAQIKDFPFRG